MRARYKPSMRKRVRPLAGRFDGRALDELDGGAVVLVPPVSDDKAEVGVNASGGVHAGEDLRGGAGRECF